MVLGIVFAALTVTAALAPLLARWFGRDAGWFLAAAFLTLAIAIAAQAPGVFAGQTPAFGWAWIPAADIDFRLRLDGIGLLFAMLILGVGAIIMAYCARYFGRETSMSRFYFFMGLFAVAMLGVVLADDILLLFVFWELTSICSFFLIGGASLTADKPAFRALVVTAGGGLALLLAVGLLSVRAGTTQLSVILSDLSWVEDGWTGPAVALCVIVAAFTKSAQVPFHFWLPGAMAATTPVSAYLHAAAMVKAGIYLLMRFTPAFGDLALWNVLLVGLGLTTAIWGGVLALKATDLKILTAHSTVSQLGFLVAAIGVGTSYALAAAALHTLAHALFKATLFMMVGVVDHQAHTRDIRELGGLRKAMPISAVIAGLAAMSLAGLPPLLGFYTKEKLFAGFLEVGGGSWAAAAAAVLAAAITFGYAARYWYFVFGGPLTTRTDVREAPPSFLLGPAITGVAGLAVGLGVPSLVPLAERVASDGGFGATTIAIHAIPELTPDLGMSLMAVLLGVVLFRMRDRIAAIQRRATAPVSGDRVFDSVHGLALAAGRRTGDATRTSKPAAHIPPVLFVLGCLAAAALWWGLPIEVPAGQATQPLDWIVIGGIAAATLGTVVSRARVAAVVLLGVVGALIGVWFLLLGAVDLALTQLVVEVLTIVALVLVLRRLPRLFHRTGPVRNASAAAVALAAGLLAGIGTFLLTGRRELSAVSEWLMTNSEEFSGGVNVVNTILVDFRALDTLGEVTVVGMAGLGILALLETTRLQRERSMEITSRPEDNPADNAIVLRTVTRIALPAFALLSVYMLFRGHNDHGGGFIGALVAGAGLCLVQLTTPNPLRSPVRKLPGVALIAGGLALALLMGGLGLFYGGFLRPFPIELGITYVSSAVVFDIGIYLVVVGTVIVMLKRLAAGAPATGGDPPRVAARPDGADRVSENAEDRALSAVRRAGSVSASAVSGEGDQEGSGR